ncbi:MAG TPA: heterodisulfide reductase-related iron-sulfur binding cluster [Candidatus Krumholzibacteria bacterium]
MNPRPSIAEQLRSCIHCGLCLDACPTYRLLGDEAESPRGRLQLMQVLLEPEALPNLSLAEMDRTALDRCLGCRHCEAVCPSGVPYGELLESSRAALPALGGRQAWAELLVRHVLTRPLRFALLAKLAYLLRSFARFLPAELGDLVPDRAPAWPRRAGARGEAGPQVEGTPEVYILAGCAQQVLQPEVARAVERLLQACGFRPRILGGVDCCGALDAHLGASEAAAKRTEAIAARARRGATILVPSAGCSSHLRHIDGVVDGVVWLHRNADRLSFLPDLRRVLYHPPCHHTHAQGIGREALELLRRVPGLEVVQADEPERCCGSAGSYQLLQPELATRIRAEKMERIRAQEPDLLLSANPGCEIFLRRGFQQTGQELPTENLLVYLASRLGGLEAAAS